MYINCPVLTFDDDRRSDDDGEPDTDSIDVSLGVGGHHSKMPHVEMVAPQQTPEEKAQKEEPQGKRGGAYF